MAGNAQYKRATLATGTKTADENGSAVSGFGGFSKLGAQLVVTAHAGTSPTLDVKIQHSIDGGTTWFDLITFTQVTTTDGNQYKVYADVEGTTAQMFGDALRAVIDVGGTSPSYTLSVSVYAEK